eukprot:3502600-Prymnesium_polylepis.1
MLQNEKNKHKKFQRTRSVTIRDRLENLQYNTLAVLLAFAVFDFVQPMWSDVRLSPCSPIVLAAIFPGTPVHATGLTLLFLLYFGMVVAGAPPTPAVICSLQVPAIAIELACSTIGILLGLAFMDTFAAAADALVPGVSSYRSNAALAGVVTSIVLMTAVYEFCCKGYRAVRVASGNAGVFQFASGLPDCCEASPEFYRVCAEIPNARLVELRLLPGEEDMPHEHPRHSRFFVTDCKLAISDPLKDPPGSDPRVVD